MTDIPSPIAFVTGASRGIGEGIARALASAGYTVACVARSHEAIALLADEIGGLAVQADLQNPEEIEAAVARVESECGPIDVLVSNAGIAMSAPLHKTSDEDWARTIGVNLTAGFLLTRRVVPGMVQRGRGRVIYIASNAGLSGYQYTSAYCASKHGIIGLMRALAVENARSGVTFNAICPGFVETEIVEKPSRIQQRRVGMLHPLDKRSKMNPQRRLIQVDEVVHGSGWRWRAESTDRPSVSMAGRSCTDEYSDNQSARMATTKGYGNGMVTEGRILTIGGQSLE